jgi:hypothetical protein
MHKSVDPASVSEMVQNEQPLVLGRDGSGPQNQPASIWMCCGQRRARRLASPIPVIGLRETPFGNRCRSSATSETTDYGLTPRRAFDLQPRDRLRSAV